MYRFKFNVELIIEIFFLQRQFVDSVKKALVPHAVSKQLCEAAAVTCVRLCKTSTYINILDSNNVVFSLVQNVISDLKVIYCCYFSLSF